MAKIIIPRNPKKSLELAQKILDKHVADGEASVLSSVIPEGSQQVVTNGLQLNNQIEELEKQIEKLYKDRDAQLKDAFKMIRRSRDILKSVYSDNLRQLGDYGFTVND